MERITETTTTITTNTHEFYCDECETHLGTSTELDDGHYEEFGVLELNFITPNGWYGCKKHLCDTHKESFLSTVYSTLESLGFEHE